MAKAKYYNISNILKTGAQYMILLGQRANGKSYQAKKTAIVNAYNNKKKFVYLRRWKLDISAKAVKAYFDDMPIQELTNDEFDTIEAYNGSLFFGKYTEDGKIERCDEIGKYCALNEAERYKSWAFKDYDYIIFEEFITDNIYLHDEPTLLQQFVSTVARLDKITVLMIGNTLTRVCPYFSEWCLDGVLKQKQGTIEIYHFHIDDINTVDIAVEYCANADYKNKMFFGQTAKQIVSGEWDTKEEPKLPQSQNNYENVYEIKVCFQKFTFVMQLLIDKETGGAVVFVYPYTGTREIYRIITDAFSVSRFVSTTLDRTRKPESMIIDCWRQNKFCYSDNLTGADFKNIQKTYGFI